MDKKQKILLVCSLIGLLILMILSWKIEPNLVKINEITNDSLTQKIKVITNISYVKNFDNSSFKILDLKDETGEISGVLNSDKNLTINKSKQYIVYGEVSEYNKTVQVQITKIKIFD